VTLPVLKIAVVGHTNAGKTSLMRTLMRDVEFGEVSESPGTTREVSGCALLVDGEPLIELCDTPGLEDSIALLESLEAGRKDHRVDGLQLVQAFLDSPEARGRFRQEAMALREILECDVALYVVDARDRVLAKYRDELRILAYCARPVVPVLNFVAASEARTEEWRDQLARVNMHAVAEFDTVVLEEGGEIRLFEKVRSLLDRFRPTIDRLIDQRRREREELMEASARLVADMLVDVAAYSKVVDLEEGEASRRSIDSLREEVRRREQRCVNDLLELHRFRVNDYVASDLPLEHGEWGADLFSQQALQEYGVWGGGGAAAGAMVGLSVDALLGGASLGAGAAIGAAIGAALSAGKIPGKHLLERLRGKTRLRCDQSTLHLLALRQVDLVRALLHRGHAGRTPLQFKPDADATRQATLVEVPRLLTRARGRAEWSRLSPEWREAGPVAFAGRERLVNRLAESLLPTIRS